MLERFMKKIAVIIPAYNEESSIADVIRSINKLSNEEFHFQPLVVNDCSRDNTAKIAAAEDCLLLNLPVNLGIGGAVQTGFRYAFLRKFDFAFQVDGDGQHPSAFIPSMVEFMMHNNCDVLIGSRFIQKKGFQTSAARRAGIRYFKWLIRLLCGITITDATSGFRLLNRKALSIVSEYYPDEYPEPESIILFYLHRLKILEIPVEMNERSGGQSSIQRLDSFYYMIKVSLAIFYTFIRTKQKTAAWKI